MDVGITRLPPFFPSGPYPAPALPGLAQAAPWPIQGRDWGEISSWRQGPCSEGESFPRGIMGGHTRACNLGKLTLKSRDAE